MSGKSRRKATFETATGEDRWNIDVLTVEQVLSLTPSTELVYAARALGIGRSVALRQARQFGHIRYGDDRLPVTKVGMMWRVRRADLLRVLGVDDLDRAGAV